MLVVGIRATFRAWLHYYFGRALQGPRFFEAPMPSLFHVVLPERNVRGLGESTAAPLIEDGQFVAPVVKLWPPSGWR
jgi:hypothetical protein